MGLICVFFRVAKVLFPPIPRPPLKYKGFLEKSDTFNVSTQPQCSHPLTSPGLPLTQPHTRVIKGCQHFVCVCVVSSSSTLFRQLSQWRRSQRWRTRSKSLKRHYEKNNVGSTLGCQEQSIQPLSLSVDICFCSAWSTSCVCFQFNSIQFLCIAQFHKLQICLRGLYNLYT